MWVCLRVRKNLIVKGRQIHYKPGDWVQVGRQTAEQWLASGAAYMITQECADTGVNRTSGVVIRGALSDDWRDRLQSIQGLKFAFATVDWVPSLPFSETLIWRPQFEPRLDLIVVGFKRLEQFQVAVPLWDYETLATSAGTAEERERTQAVIRDLRVPLRDTRMVFVRRCGLTRSLIVDWGEALAAGDDEQLSFLRVMYQHKPVVCDLPASWTGRVTA